MAKAATEGDTASGDTTVTHRWLQGNTQMSSPCAFTATIDGAVSGDVFFDGRKAATTNSTAAGALRDGTVPNRATPTPSTKGTINSGSASVFVNGVAVARDGDGVTACGSQNGTLSVTQTSTVFIGD